MDRRDRPCFDKPCKRLALPVVELGGPARRLAVNQSFRPPGIETQHPVPDHLKTDITDPCRIPALAAIVNLGQRKETAALSSILRRLGQSPQSRTIKIFP